MTSLEVIQPEPVAALAALLDDGLAAPGPGDILPPMWHWVALARWPLSSELTADGHPEHDSFVPPADLPRRMFAGGEVRFHGELRIGQTIRRESVLESVTEKAGRSGRLLLLVHRTRITDDDGDLVVDERRDIIYRGAGAPTAAAGAPAAAPAGAPLRRAGEWSWDFATDPTLLMRFSAATANPHRIHYDWPYVTQVEGYPGLLVQGPLMTLALTEVVRLERGDVRAGLIRHRNKAPLFCGQPARLRGAAEADAVNLELVGPEGTCSSVAMSFRG